MPKSKTVANKLKAQTELPKPPAPRVAPQPLTVLPAVAFLAIYFVCLWKRIDVRLLYHGGGQLQDFPCFYWGWEFLRDFRTHPGGLVEYGAALMAQSLYYSWFGALVLTLQAAMVVIAVGGLLRLTNWRWLKWTGFIAPLLFLAIYSKYRHFSVPVTSFTLGIALVLGWHELKLRLPRWSLSVALVLVGCLYAAAPSALLVFVPLAVAAEFCGDRSLLRLLGWLGLAGLVPWLAGAAFFGFAPLEAYAKILPLVWDPLQLKKIGVGLVIALYLLPWLFGLAAILWKLRIGGPGATVLIKGPAPGPRLIWWGCEALALALVPLIVVLVSLNPQIKSFMSVDYLAWHGRWPEIFAAAKPNARNPFVACALAQASYHTGTLTLKLPALSSPAELTLYGDKLPSHWKKSDLYYDLGYLNMALHHLTESMEFYGERPVLLQRLAIVNLALTNVSTAKVYLGTLTRAPFQGAWARACLERLKTDPTLSTDPEVSRLRRLMVQRDSVVALSADEELLMLLAANRQNRMAFEYLMTYYLLTKNLQAFVKNLSRIKDFPGFQISPLWDEALLLASLEAGRYLDVPGHVISAEARARVAAVSRVVQKNGDNAELSRRQLTADYADTYAYYWFFHL